MRDVAQVGAVEAGDVFVRVAELKLLQNIVPHALGGAGGEGGDRLVGKVLAQRAQLAVLGAEFVAPFGDAVGFVDGEERQRHAAQPRDGIVARQALRRKIQQAVSALHRAFITARWSSCDCELLSTAAGIPMSASCAA
jgi:hypothetical protein